MDAIDPSLMPTFASRTPLHIGGVGMIARDLDRMVAFYRDVIGLSVLKQTSGNALLGVGDVGFLELIHRPNALPDDPREAGLYHNAFLMPTRADLGRWLIHAAQNRVPFTGASDHAVSEAIYLDDPEGNGIEVYRDRLSSEWRWDNDTIHMTTERLDLNDVAAAGAERDWTGAPLGLRIGHVHLRVGAVPEAERFYTQTVGLARTFARRGAVFMSSGGYHHHIASNVWHSDGAHPRNPDRAGLAYVTLEASDAVTYQQTKDKFVSADLPMTDDNGSLEISDPWSTRVRLIRA